MLFVTAYLTCHIAGRLRREESRLAALTDHLAQLEEAKSRLLTFVAHEMKSPLVAITSCIQAATSILGKEKAVPNKAVDMLERAKRRSDQMGLLVRELLELSCQRSLPKDAIQDRADLKKLLQTVVDDWWDTAQDKGIALSLAACEEDVEVRANLVSLHKAFSNLANNAIQYTPKGGHVEVSLLNEDTHAKVLVADSGIGIPEEDMENIFQEFYRSPNAKKQSQVGTGLGLAIVRTIVENHGGHVAVESRIGKGSTFSVCLPQAWNVKR